MTEAREQIDPRDARAPEAARGFASYVEDFRRTVELYAPRLLAMSDEEASRCRGGEGSWSAKQIVGHLVDSAANNHRRFVLAQLKDDLVFDGYEQEGWVNAQRYNAEPWPQLVELWRAYNLHLAHVMSSAPAEILTRESAAHTLDRIAFKLVPASRPTTLEYLMRDYADHLRHHLAQIFPEATDLS